MQPYFFPYLPYFQLANAVDRFVFFDDVQHIRRGWVHRNRVLVNGAAHTITLPVEKGRRADFIQEKRFAPDAADDVARIAKTLENAYARAPFQKEMTALFARVAGEVTADAPIAPVLAASVIETSRALGLSTAFLWSSDLSVGADLRGQAKILAICKRLGAARYINPIGGAALYDPAAFRDAGVDLRFLRAAPPAAYPQPGGGPFEPDLSILDMIAAISGGGAAGRLDAYTLIEAA